MNQLFSLTLLIVAINFMVFFLAPNSLSVLAFSGQAFFNGEVWRLLTFPFVHINLVHLIENIIALTIVALLALEVDLKRRDFLCCFVLSGILIALPEGLLFPSILIAGSSLGIYGVLGSLSIKGSVFVPKYILVPVLGLSAFIGHSLSTLTCPECAPQGLVVPVFHFSGFLAGIFVFYSSLTISKRTRRKLWR